MTPEYLNSIVTLAVGLIALLVYWLAKRHERRNAATIIVMDIRHAEQVVLSLLERQVVDRSLKAILYENNWAKYKHLFAQDFSYDDFASLNRFFDACVEILEARRRMHQAFFAGVNAKAELLQQKILEIPNVDTPAGQEERAKVIQRFNSETYAFDPQDPRNTVLLSLQLMGKPSNTMAFERLKRVANIGA